MIQTSMMLRSHLGPSIESVGLKIVQLTGKRLVGLSIQFWTRPVRAIALLLISDYFLVETWGTQTLRSGFR